MNCNFVQSAYSTALAKRIGVDKLEDIMKFPKFFSIETTNICNAKCIMCPHSAFAGGKMMEDECFDKIVDELKHYTDWITSVALYWYGEPLLDSKLCERIRLLKKNGIENIQISTNAERLDKETAEDLFKSGLNDLRISLDAIHKDTYEKIRGLDYGKVMDNIHSLLELRNKQYRTVPIRIRMVEMEENKDEIDAFKTYWEKYVSNIDKVQTMPQLVNKLWKEECETKNMELPCVSVFSTLAIDVDGNICICCMDTNKEIILGNIKNISLQSVWRGEQIQNIRMKHLEGKKFEIPICKNCNCWQREFEE